jgi:branched-chain amino acid transport system permease protein
MVIIGGMNTTIGPVLGAAFITIFPAQVNINPFWQEVLFGSLFVAVIVLFPEGFIGLLRFVARHVLRPLAREAPPPLAAEPEDASRPVGSADVEKAVAAERAGPVAAAPEGAAIVCREIVFRYPAGPAVLRNVDFSVRRGTIHGLIGPNGSGKSTLVDLISGRLRPESGTITVHGVDMERQGVSARAHEGLSRTFQSAALVGELPARQNVSIGLYRRIPRLVPRAPVWPVLPSSRRESRKIRTSVMDALAFVGADRWAGARMADVPHGVEQLTQLAAACVGGPQTLILDEPLAGLSPSEVEHAATILAKLKSQGVSIVLIEHQPRFVFALCDEVTVLAAGEVVATGPASVVREDAQVRAVYLGQ